MQLLLIRHARPARTQTADGPADPPLTELGVRQAEALAAWLAEEDIDTLYTSPLRRAVQTADPVATKLGLTPVVEAGISEYDAHARSYIPIEDLKATGDLRAAELPEDADAFQQTVIDSIEAITARHPAGTVALVCHGGVINVYLSWALQRKGMQFFFLPDYTSISRVLASGDGRRTVHSLNEAAHLRIAGVPYTELTNPS